MNIRGFIAGLALVCNFMPQAQAQEVQGLVHGKSSASDYVWPEDKQVLDKLRKWQDLKFGVLFHWGLYSVPGIVESWSICSEDVDWIRRPAHMGYDDYKKWYWGLKDSLNPVRFNPEKWASVMKDAGVKYMLFTTKHHDGFCMYDSKYTDFSIAHGPFANNPQKNVAKEVFNAFRKDGFMIGCYFSKPDWHCPWYWNPYFATPTRSFNYKQERHPDWWQNYRRYVQNQLNELTTDYGNIDILWLDGGWVSGDEVGLDSVLVGARKRNPGLLSVDRTIRGKNENYQTPERGIPEKWQAEPWESCIPLSDDWGWTPNARYKSANQVIALLSQIVAKGGALALGIGPRADGTLDPAVVSRLEQVGKWLKVNGAAIYSTVSPAWYHDGDIWFTSSKDRKTMYAIYAPKDGTPLPATLQWSDLNLPKGTLLLMQTGKAVKYVHQNGKVIVTLPKGLRNEPLAFKFKPKKLVLKAVELASSGAVR